MPQINLDILNQRLLGLLQMEFPLTSMPFTDLGVKLNIESDEVIQRIQQFKNANIVRQISPVFDARKLGFQSTLVGMKVAEKQLKKAEEIIAGHPGVSHGYHRQHDFNIWITLSLPGAADLSHELDTLASAVSAETIFSLPVLKVFKLRTYFGLERDEPPETGLGKAGRLPSGKSEISLIDRSVINELQQDLPLINRPFNEFASHLGMNESDFLKRCNSLLKRGIMRRFGASINHRQAGYTANAMACWMIEPGGVEEIGQKLASLKAVSHCYERKTNPWWKYNLFAMVHGSTEEDCLNAIDGVSDETGHSRNIVLFSTREFKKTRVKYQV